MRVLSSRLRSLSDFTGRTGGREDGRTGGREDGRTGGPRVFFGATSLRYLRRHASSHRTLRYASDVSTHALHRLGAQTARLADLPSSCPPCESRRSPPRAISAEAAP